MLFAIFINSVLFGYYYFELDSAKTFILLEDKVFADKSTLL